MTNEEWYKYTEKILRSYRRNVESALRVQEELDILRECGDMAGMRYAEGHASGSGDPVLSYVMRAEGLENKLKRIKRRVRVVERLREDLRNGEIITVTSSRNLLRILTEHYIDGLTVTEFLRITSWVRSTFYARRRELVMIAGEYLRA